MEDNTSLVPDTLKVVATDYKNSFLFIFKNKWLYLVTLFFILCGIFTHNLSSLYQKFLYPDLFKQPFLLNNLYQTTQPPFSEQIIHALSSIHLSNVLSSFSLLGIFNSLGIVIAFFFLYKKIKNLYKLPFTKKVGKFSLFLFLFGLVMSLISYLFFKNIIIISLGVFIGLISIKVLFIILFTPIEIVFIYFLKSLLYNEKFSLDSISSRSETFLKPLFIFNTILAFASSSFLASVALFPDTLNLLVFGNLGNFTNSIPQTIYVGIISIVKYFNAFFTIIFIFTPFILALNSSESLFSAMREDISLIKRKLGYYLWLILGAILFSVIISVAMELLNSLLMVYLNYNAQELIYSTTRSLVFTFFLLTVFVTVFRSVINFSRKSDSLNP